MTKNLLVLLAVLALVIPFTAACDGGPTDPGNGGNNGGNPNDPGTFELINGDVFSGTPIGDVLNVQPNSEIKISAVWDAPGAGVSISGTFVSVLLSPEVALNPTFAYSAPFAGKAQVKSAYLLIPDVANKDYDLEVPYRVNNGGQVHNLTKKVRVHAN